MSCTSGSNQRLMNVNDAAAYLGLTVGTIYHLVSECRIPVIRLSKRCIRFRVEALDQWLEEKTEPGTA